MKIVNEIKRMRYLPPELFEEISKDVTGAVEKEVYTSEEAKEILARCLHVTGRVIEEEIIDDEEDEILKEFGF